ncbi:hypothetical protein D047_4057A, partial [Vibrio parahaemolyticus VPTS-2010_2]
MDIARTVLSAACQLADFICYYR